MADGLDPTLAIEPPVTATIEPSAPAPLAAQMRLGFSAGCNAITASVQGEVIGNLITTEMGCPEDSFEPQLIEILDNGRFRVINDHQFSVGELLFTWWLGPGEPRPANPEAVLRDGVYQGGYEEQHGEFVSYTMVTTADVSAGGTQFVFDAGCNILRTSLVNGALAPIAATRMACPPGGFEDLFLAQADSGDLQVLSDTQFRVGEITFGWVGDAGTELPRPGIAAQEEHPTIDLEWQALPTDDEAGSLAPENEADFGVPLFAIGQLHGERVVLVNLFGSSSCPPVIEQANVIGDHLTIRLDAMAYGPDQVCTADLARHAFVLTPRVASGAMELPAELASGTLDGGSGQSGDGSSFINPAYPMAPGTAVAQDR